LLVTAITKLSATEPNKPKRLEAEQDILKGFITFAILIAKTRSLKKLPIAFLDALHKGNNDSLGDKKSFAGYFERFLTIYIYINHPGKTFFNFGGFF
jgi:hypothetical protein